LPAPTSNTELPSESRVEMLVISTTC